MMGKLEELALRVSHLIPFLGLFQEFSSVLSTLIKLVLDLLCRLSFPCMVCMFLCFTEQRGIRGIQLLNN